MNPTFPPQLLVTPDAVKRLQSGDDVKLRMLTKRGGTQDSQDDFHRSGSFAPRSDCKRAARLIPALIALQTSAGLGDSRFDDRNIDELFISRFIRGFDAA